MTEPRRSAYLIAYDYGTGGLWGAMLARDETEIRMKFPELIIVHERPNWMSEAYYSDLLATPYDIDEPPRGLLAALLADRDRG